MSNSSPLYQHRNTLRHVEYDYTAAGAYFVTMPNHVQALLWLKAHPEQQTKIVASKPRKFGDGLAGLLSILINAYKGAVTQQAKKSGLLPAAPLWQTNFGDRIVRVAQELEQIRGYIQANPARGLDE